MAGRKVAPTQPKCEPMTKARAQELAEQWADLESARLNHTRLAGNLERIQKRIVALLEPWTAKAGKLPVRNLDGFRLEVIQVAASFSPTDALVEAIGAEKVEKLKAAVGTKPRLEITDLRVPAA